MDDDEEKPENDPGHPMFVNPITTDPRDWYFNQEALRESKAQQDEEARGK
jgi:hypothetical protein